MSVFKKYQKSILRTGLSALIAALFVITSAVPASAENANTIVKTKAPLTSTVTILKTREPIETAQVNVPAQQSTVSPLDITSPQQNTVSPSGITANQNTVSPSGSSYNQQGLTSPSNAVSPQQNNASSQKQNQTSQNQNSQKQNQTAQNQNSQKQIPTDQNQNRESQSSQSQIDQNQPTENPTSQNPAVNEVPDPIDETKSNDSGEDHSETDDPAKGNSETNVSEGNDSNQDNADNADPGNEDTEADDAESIEEKLPPTELGYWYEGIDAEEYAERLRKAAYEIPTTGKGYCASWVSYVYQDAGLGYIVGNACDMWRAFCIFTDTAEIREGMMIAVPTSPTSELGRIYGHVGVLVKNEDYIDPLEEIQELQNEIEICQAELELSANKSETIKFNARLQELKHQLEEIEAKEPQDYKMQDRTISVDRYGNEKWLVVDNIGRITESRLSSWLLLYNQEGKAAWGWGHFYAKPTKWTGDILTGVSFVYHEDEATEEDLEEERMEEETEEITQEETTKDSSKDKKEEKSETTVISETDPQTETDPAQQPVTEPETEPATEPETEPGTEPASEPEEEFYVEPITEPYAEPLPEPCEEPYVEPAPEPYIEPVPETFFEPAPEPVIDVPAILPEEEIMDATAGDA